MSGKPCLLWSQETKANGEIGYWTGDAGAADVGVGNHNHCRNPQGETAWCYTYDKYTEWEECDLGSA